MNRIHVWTPLRVPLHIVEERRRRLAEHLQRHAYAPLQEVCARFQISEATARRDLAALASRKQIVRTYGGALSEYNHRFPSFRERQTKHTAAKRRIATAASLLVQPGMTCFLDFGTTIFALAEALQNRPVPDLKIVTNNLPVAELLTGMPGTRVYLLGGELLARQSVLLGKGAVKAVRFHSLDLAFFCAEAADAAGTWNSQEEIVGIQRQVLAEAARSVLCLDASKFKRTAPAFLAPWGDFDLIISNAKARQTEGLPASKMRSV